MTEPLNDPVVWVAADLLDRYGFERGAFSAEQLIGYWLRSYPAEWIRSAVLEALYQGRYKSVSVGQILAIWKRRGQPLYHYSFEFERMICGTLSRIPTASAPTVEPTSLAKAVDDPLQAIATQISEDQAIAPTDADSSSISEETTPPKHEMHGLADAIAPSEPEAEASVHVSTSNEANPLPELSATDEGIVDSQDVPPLESSLEEVGDRPSPLAPSPASDNDFAFLAVAANWTQPDLIRPSIHQFIPDNEGSLFYEKLRAVAHEQLN
ncbi:MAG: hypothetical protein AAFX78_05320 [Cyanobacteria bacterium J06638_20]